MDMTNEQINERIMEIRKNRLTVAYTRDTFAAMELAKEMMAAGFKLEIYRTMLAYDDAYECTATTFAHHEIYTHAAPTIEVAICLVWLAWKEEGE